MTIQTDLQYPADFDSHPRQGTWEPRIRPAFVIGGRVYIVQIDGDEWTVGGNIGIDGYRSSDSTYQPIRLDKATNTIQTIDHSHHEIHAGSHFFVTDYQTIGSAASVDWLIVTPDTTKWAHLTFEVQGTAITTAALYEGSDRSGTTGLTEVNNDRNSATAATVAVYRGVNGGTTDGTAIWQSSGGSAVGSFRGGADNRQEAEIILKRNTKYVLKVTSGTASNICAVKLRWYEHTNIA